MHQYSKMSVSANTPPRLAGVKIAIANYKRQNHMVDENKAEHVAAYILLRETQMRVSGKMLVDYLESLRTTVTHGDSSTFHYWAVPRGNFPNGLPPNIVSTVLPIVPTNNHFPAT